MSNHCQGQCHIALHNGHQLILGRFLLYLWLYLVYQWVEHIICTLATSVHDIVWDYTSMRTDLKLSLHREEELEEEADCE